jgi:5-methyltetrahydrofolate--homocysteine methyltransferase
MTRSLFLDRVRQHVVFYDGAMGTTIQTYELTAADYGGAATDGCPEILPITRPDVIEAIHASFLEVGCDVIETDTFTGSRLKLNDYGLGERTHEINLAAARLARRVADRFSTAEHPRFVAGSMGPTGFLPSSDDPVLSNVTYAQLVECFSEQALALIEGGVDVLLIETSQDILEVRAAITGIHRARRIAGRFVPIQAQVTLDTSGRMLLGTDIAAAMATLLHLGVDVIGLNCSTGPEHMREPIRYLAEHCPLPVSAIPNAGIPLNAGGRAVYPMQPAAMAAELASFVIDLGVNIVGGCCGTTPEHLRQLIGAVGRRPAPTRVAVAEPLVASGMRAVSLRQEPPPLLVGERVNAQGSRKAKQCLLNDDYDGLLAIGREQMDSGAHVLDVCVALTERADEAEQMRRTVKKLSMGVELPLVIDSTEAGVIQAALETYPGRAVINSINLENGRQRVDAVLPLAHEHGSAVVALTIDEEGMAKTADCKLAVARRIYEIATQEYELRPDALIFDTLTFPLTTGQEDLRNSAQETLESIRRIKAELPGALTILGVSNVSFGVAPHARAVLNSVFLYHAVAAGLDLAIVNPAHITPYAEIDAEQRAICEDLIANRDPDALPRFIEYFERHGGRQQAIEKVDPTEGLSVDEKIHYQILHRQKEGIEALLQQAMEHRLALHPSGGDPGLSSDDPGPPGRDPGPLGPGHGRGQEQAILALKGQGTDGGQEERGQEPAPTGVTPNVAAVDIINNVLLPAMKDVGDRFGAGELILPFVLQSAEVMKRAVAFVEQFLERKEGYTKGRVVLATVFGDVHDIGKNLVNTILANNGYTVYDLGKQVPLNTIIAKAQEVQADAIGLSALLVSTSKQMPLCVQELHQRGLSYPVIIGGAAINRAYGRRTLFVQDGDRRVPYAPGVFYARDAFEGLSIMDQLSNPEQRNRLVVRTVREAEEHMAREEVRAQAPAPVPAAPARRIPPAPVPRPPFWGPRVLERIGLEDVAVCMDENTLFRLHWGGKVHGADFAQLVEEEFRPRLTRMLREARQQRALQPRVVYGYFPCRAAGDELIVYAPDDHRREVTRFRFPRQPDMERLCLANYFVPLEAPEPDVVALQVVTMGDRATELISGLQQRGDYASAYYLHGLAVEMAEGLAEYTHRLVRRELGLAPDRGKRYSWGYPAIPDLADHERVFTLLPARETIGVDLTTGYQLVPEQSTAAIVVHHPAAVYFSVRAREAVAG